MKKSKFLLLQFALLTFSLNGQNIPVDFEENGIGSDWNWRTFENLSDPPLEIIVNPDSSGINLSDSVAKFTALAQGQAFAGFESMHGSDIGSFTIDQSNALIRIMVWKSVISDVGIKLVRADNWSLGEIKIPNTKINEWEQIEFDFSSHIGNTYDQIVIFPDFAERQGDNVIYIDNIYGEVALSSNLNSIDKIDLNISPNPVRDFLYFNSNQINLNFTIHSLDGKNFNTRIIQKDKIDTSNLPSGSYILKAQSPKGFATKLFIKI